MKKFIYIILALAAHLNVNADGILMPRDTAYPKPFLKNLLTEVTVNIHGQMVETTVYQEFFNEWSDTVDAVWNFPMPADASTTRLQYWQNDSAYDAVLIVAQQTVNPGTGEGGIAALVNDYIGKTGIKLEIQNIPPHSVQKVRFSYFSLLSYTRGLFTYKYPLNTSDFIQYYLGYLKVNINVNSKSKIVGFDFPGYNSDTQVLYSDSNRLSLQMIKNKAYLSDDFSFMYNILQDSLNVDFYSNYCDTMPSHFGLFVKPPLYEIPARILAKRIVFLVSNSSSMSGYKLQQSVSALCDALDSLKSTDVFNIVLYNTATSLFNPVFLIADSNNIQNAKAYLQAVTAQGGSDLNVGLATTLSLFSDSSYQNCIMGFSDGHSVIDPVNIANFNIFKTAISFIAIGKNIDRERLEMTASLNYGFVTYAGADDNLREKVLDVFYKINAPVIKHVSIAYNKPDVNMLVPLPYPSINAGSSFYVAGRYNTPSQNQVTVSGRGVIGMMNYDFTSDYTGDTLMDFFVRYLWAKSVMDNLERQILIYGENPLLVDSLINISLGYKMKCRYTAYITLEIYNGGSTTGNSQPSDFVQTKEKNITMMPNPFTDRMTVSVLIPSGGGNKTRLLKIFSPNGILIRVIDLSGYGEGKHNIEVDFTGMPAGVYFVMYQEGNNSVSSLKAVHL